MKDSFRAHVLATDKRLGEQYEAEHGRPIRPYRPRVSGFVYFIQAGNSGPVKIGWARDPESRCRELQTGNPSRLFVVAQVRGNVSLELALHELLADYRIEGEWFEDAPAVRAVLAAAVEQGAGGVICVSPFAEDGAA